MAGAVQSLQIIRDRMPRRLVQLVFGLSLFGLGGALLLHSGLGTGSWDVLTQGISRHVPLSFGTITVITSGIVLLLWIPLRQRPGIGTVLNAVLVGVFVDIGLRVFPVPHVLWTQIASLAVGIIVIGIASGVYIGAGLGPGPRDGLMTGLTQRTGWPIWVVRTIIEVTIVVIGWLLGGIVGIGTIAVTFAIGPLCQIFLPMFAIRDRPAIDAVVDPLETEPEPA